MRAFISVLCLSLCCNNTYAWDGKGHEVIALIAWHYLSPATRDRIDALLQEDRSGLTATDFVSESTWADVYRDSDRSTTQIRYEQTRRWHYVNLDITQPDLRRACFDFLPLPRGRNASEGPAKSCVIDKIEQFADELESPQTISAERLRALQFLIHFVGDLHQPLHASGNDDSGGNAVQVTAKGFKHGSLHGYWDNAVISQLGRKPEAIARKLIAQMRQSEIERWQQGNPRNWALDSFAMARDIAYLKLPSANEADVHALDENYTTLAKSAATQQLMKAGVRLAQLLEQSFSRQ